MPPPGLQICHRSRVILTFDLLTPKVDLFIPLLHGPFVSGASKSVNLLSNIVLTNLVKDEGRNGRTIKWTRWEHYVINLVWRRSNVSADVIMPQRYSTGGSTLQCAQIFLSRSNRGEDVLICTACLFRFDGWKYTKRWKSQKHMSVFCRNEWLVHGLFW